MEHNFECNNGMYLEPRLQEYIKKKICYKKNRINPVVPLEQEFNISREDMKRLKDFKSGDKDIYNHKTQDKYMEKIDGPYFEFDPDEVYKSDPRYHRFIKKKKRDKEAMRQRHNYGLEEDYENAFSPITDFMNENTRLTDMTDNNLNNINFREDPNLLDGRDFNLNLNSKRIRTVNKYECKNPRISERSYSELPQYTPRTSFRNRIYPMQNNRAQEFPIDHNPRMREIIGELDSYGNKINSTYEHTLEMDTDNKVVIPNVTSNGKKMLNSSSYRPVPYIGRAEGIRDVLTECEIMNSLPTRGSKSYGYFNPVEHYYDYISNDIQDPDHVVFEPGISTRLDNHRIARPYKREIY